MKLYFCKKCEGVVKNENLICIGCEQKTINAEGREIIGSAYKCGICEESLRNSVSCKGCAGEEFIFIGTKPKSSTLGPGGEYSDPMDNPYIYKCLGCEKTIGLK